ncbi:SAM-dependent methyltransferase [Streptomyces cacaoi]|uniref:SAM-dependent methyltransferase n=1 Tax=Streptomyces cacaoi TaxID=1898 RepID=UPI0011F0C805|nr:SAM-dependent methyltransferase [Streptomyces cacaoi]
MDTSKIDVTKPHAARMYDYLLGGKSNYGVDRRAAVKTLNILPDAATAARHNRSFMHRAVHFLSREHGMRQFLDIGIGIPTPPNLHQVAQREHPEARIVYCDNDPIVLAHARALMNSTDEGVTDYVEADVREPQTILDHAAHTLDFARPVTVSLVALLHFIPDGDDPHGIVRALMEPLAPGSALILSHGTADFEPVAGEVARHYRNMGIDLDVRPRETVAAMFDGLDLLEPGLVPSCDWRPDYVVPDDTPILPGSVSPAETCVWAGVALKQ